MAFWGPTLLPIYETETLALMRAWVPSRNAFCKGLLHHELLTLGQTERKRKRT